MDFVFYSLSVIPTSKFVTSVIEKFIDDDKSARIFLFTTHEELAVLDGALWTNSKRSFIPHDILNDNILELSKKHSSVLISDDLSKLDMSFDMIVATRPIEYPVCNEELRKVVYIFQEMDSINRNSARQVYRQAKLSDEHTVKCYIQKGEKSWVEQ